jgi:hypothetical protein
MDHAEELAKRYLEAFKLLTTADTAGPAIVLGVLQAMLGDAMPNTLSLVTLGASLLAFFVSLFSALLGMLLVTTLGLASETATEPDSDLSFLALSLLVLAIFLFFVGLFAALQLLSLAILDINLVE